MLICAAWDDHFNTVESKANISFLVANWFPPSGNWYVMSTSIQAAKSWRRGKGVTCISGPWFYSSECSLAQRERRWSLVVVVRSRQRGLVQNKQWPQTHFCVFSTFLCSVLCAFKEKGDLLDISLIIFYFYFFLVFNSQIIPLFLFPYAR